MNVSRIIVTTERGAKYMIDFASRSFTCIEGRSTTRAGSDLPTFYKVENIVIGGRMVVTWHRVTEEATIIYSPIKTIEAADHEDVSDDTASKSNRWCGVFPAVGSEL